MRCYLVLLSTHACFVVTLLSIFLCFCIVRHMLQDHKWPFMIFEAVEDDRTLPTMVDHAVRWRDIYCRVKPEWAFVCESSRLHIPLAHIMATAQAFEFPSYPQASVQEM